MNHHIQRSFMRYVIAISLLGSLLIGFLVPTLLTAHAQNSSKVAIMSLAHKTFSTSRFISTTDSPTVPCEVPTKRGCYTPQVMRNAYGITSLINQGITGKGETILIVVSFGSPTIAQDLHTFDTGYNLPDPPSLKVLSPLGTVTFDPTNSDQLGWANETSLDVEWAHVIAPGANIVVLTSPVAETQGVQGLPEFLKLEQYALDNHLGNILSQSWAATENTLLDSAGKAVMDAFNAFYQKAARHHITIFAASGDHGTSNHDINDNFFPFPTVNFPASSPYVTAVGGTDLQVDANKNYKDETVWNDAGGLGASGGGISQYFSMPTYQRTTLPMATQQQLKGYRGVPDVSYHADPSIGVPVYASFGPGPAGYFETGGTSESSPQWAGIIADANQLAGRPLGFINPALYRLGANSATASSSYHDITVGNNAYQSVNPVPGYDATPGWDLTTGWGSPRVDTLLPQLIALCH